MILFGGIISDLNEIQLLLQLVTAECLDHPLLTIAHLLNRVHHSPKLVMSNLPHQLLMNCVLFDFR